MESDDNMTIPIFQAKVQMQKHIDSYMMDITKFVSFLWLLWS